MKSISIYIHIPFCIKKCHYCDFLSAPATEAVQEEYLRVLKKEIQEESIKYKEYTVQTVFIGGGTPTAVKAESLCEVLNVVKASFKFSADAEISMEANPGTVDAKALLLYHKAGINRLSIGLQSAHNEELKLLGRIHTWEDFLRTYQMAVEAGFTNINVDLMSALPGQTLQSYEKTLNKVLSLTPAPAHISAYSLIIEEGTPFFEAYGEEKAAMEHSGEKQKHLPSEEEERQMYALTESLLKKAGYHRYEISNYSKEGMECRHNPVYWQRKNYVGFGLGAASMVENVRFQNKSDLTAYLKEENKQAERNPLSKEEQMEEFMFLGLRLTEGVSKQEFADCFGKNIEDVYGEVIRKNERDGLLFQGEKVALTERGRDVSNYVMAQFLL